MNKSESITNLATALAMAQMNIRGAIKDSANPFFKSKYADLSSVVEAIRPAFGQCGLSYIQRIEPSDKDEVRVETILLHASGEWLSCGVLNLPVSKADAQGYGSALTYARRYSLAAACGVAPEDDDGNAASGKNAPQKRLETLNTHLDAIAAVTTQDALKTAYTLAYKAAKEVNDTEAMTAIVAAKNSRKAELEEA
jgi:hypothetical protein